VFSWFALISVGPSGVDWNPAMQLHRVRAHPLSSGWKFRARKVPVSGKLEAELEM
jgi:hypothetical protein